MKPNNRFDSCARCGEQKGTENIFDDEGNNFWICEYCDAELFEETTLNVTGIKKEIEVKNDAKRN